MEVISNLIHGFQLAITPQALVACLLGVIIGTITGVLPGLGPTGAMALLLPLSFGMDPALGIIMLAGIYYGSMYGGSTTAILVNMPGETASVITCIDGYQMAKKGRGGAAMAVAAIGSFVAGTLGIVGLMLFAPKLALFAVKFGPVEFFALAVLGLILLSNVTGKSMLKTMLMVFLGIMLSTIGIDPQEGVERLTFGILNLQQGIEFTIVAMGFFGISEVLRVVGGPCEKSILPKVRLRDLYPNKEELKRSINPMLRGGVIGFIIGLLPGPVNFISSLVSYRMEKRLSKHPEEFGKGAVEGVAGPESANNSAAAGAMVPLLALGLPFTAATAILVSGFLVHGVAVGPLLIRQHADLFWTVIASMYIGNVMLLIFNLPLVGVFASVLKIPPKILMPIIMLITIAGAYSINNSIFDLWLLLIFAVIGYFAEKADFDGAPLVVGLVLGKTLETGLRGGLVLVQGDIWQFFKRPISGTMLYIAILLIVYSVVRFIYAKNKKVNTSTVET
jgi:putative tricarboxylic transport membrane protein